MFEDRIDLIRKGWHRVFAYVPTLTLDSGWVWWRYVERKYYATAFNRVVKKGINEDKLTPVYDLHVMHRTLGSGEEKRIYSSGKKVFRDPSEMIKDLEL